jgi:MFS family permease
VTGAHPAESGEDIGLRRVLMSLCVTQVTSWGVLYYALPVLAVRIDSETGWGLPALTAAFSAALVVSALLGVSVGRLLDRYGPRWLMTGGSVLAVAAVVGIATAPSLFWFAGAWLLAGVAMSATLYPSAFAALTRWYGPRRVGALTVVTLAGGLASTIFAPVTALLASPLGWRGTYLVLAGLLAVVTIPAHLFGLRRPWPPPASGADDGYRPDAVLRSRPFVALVVAMALAACASHAVIVNLVPLLTERRLSLQLAAVALGLGGVGQVLGRLGYPALTRRLSVAARTTLVLAGVAATTVVLAMLRSVPALVAAVVLAGVVRGVLTLLQATAVTDRWGVNYYGRLTGVLSAPVTLTAALAPWIGAALAAGLGGYAAMFVVMAGLAAAGAVIGSVSVPDRGRTRSARRVDERFGKLLGQTQTAVGPPPSPRGSAPARTGPESTAEP